MTARGVRRAAQTFADQLAAHGMAVTDVSEKDGVPTVTITKTEEGDQMAGTRTGTKETKETKGLQLHDNLGRDIEPDHARIAMAGDVFLTYEATDLPPMGAECQITLKGTISGPVQLKQVKEEDLEVWVTVVKLKAEEKIGQLKVIALPPPPDDEIDLEIPGNGNARAKTKGRSR